MDISAHENIASFSRWEVGAIYYLQRQTTKLEEKFAEAPRRGIRIPPSLHPLSLLSIFSSPLTFTQSFKILAKLLLNSHITALPKTKIWLLLLLLLVSTPSPPLLKSSQGLPPREYGGLLHPLLPVKPWERVLLQLGNPSSPSPPGKSQEGVLLPLAVCLSFLFLLHGRPRVGMPRSSPFPPIRPPEELLLRRGYRFVRPPPPSAPFHPAKFLEQVFLPKYSRTLSRLSLSPLELIEQLMIL